MFAFNLHSQIGSARVGELVTRDGVVPTPVFMPVATRASLKALDTQDINDLQAPIILGNNYHLYLKPGLETMRAFGGVQSFMGWDKPLLTDSGGFQVFSLGAQARLGSRVRISEEGVEFRSHIDGSRHFFSPESATQMQQALGSTIMMAFDELLPDNAGRSYAESSVDRTLRWARICHQIWSEADKKDEYGRYQSLFGIVQGGLFKDLRQKAARELSALDFDGIAVGGETIGYDMAGTAEVMGWLNDILPADKPRYAMGLGRDPQNIIDAVYAGFDMFDCVGPTRLARNGTLFVGQLAQDVSGKFFFESEFAKARLHIGSRPYRHDDQPIQPGCDCHTCVSGYTRGYLHHLYRVRELAYFRLASIHNVRVMVRLAAQLREGLLRG